MCFGAGALCVNAPCSPFLRLRQHGPKSKRVTLEGVLGKSNIGPLYYTSGPDTYMLQSWTEVSCGEESAYYFFVTTDCGAAPMIEYIGSSFVCTRCSPQQ